MRLYDCIMNALAVWIIKHCYNTASVFYAACEQLTTQELMGQVDEVLNHRKTMKGGM